jgi:ribosomal protein S18 acetylase RimI-like enzyme
MSTERSARLIADIAGDPALVAVARELFAEYQRELGVDLCFQGFDEELAGLPAAYDGPAGCLLLAHVGDAVAGCVGLRPIRPGVAELKRLYVRPAARGRGLARALTIAALDHALAQGYERVVLDTLPSMAAALDLYRSLGFRDVAPYRHNPVAGTRYLALELG